MTGFAQRLSELLSERGMTRADLARATGIPYHRLNPWFIRPGAKPSGPDLLLVAQYLGVSEGYLLNGGPREPFVDTEPHTAQRIRQLVALLPEHLRLQVLGYTEGVVASLDPARPKDDEESQ